MSNKYYLLTYLLISFHPLSRDNVSITQQPQPGCVQFHQIMSRDHMIDIHFRRQNKPSFLRPTSKKKKIFFHKRHNYGHECYKHLPSMFCLSHSVIYVRIQAMSKHATKHFRIFSRSSVLSNNVIRKQDNRLQTLAPATV